MRLILGAALALLALVARGQSWGPNDYPDCASANQALQYSRSNGAFSCGTMSGGGTSVPAGAIVFVDTGSCPAGYTEVAALSGRMVLGTTNASANVGTTGGSDNITPAGIVSQPTFMGNALATHAHELPFQIPSTTTTRQIAAATFGTGTSRAATAVSAAGTANTTSAAVALSQAVSAGTPSGTVSQPTFTGTQFDNRSAFIRLIGCKKD